LPVRPGSIRLFYDSPFDNKDGLKQGILLEVGFDDTTPNEAVTISSWALDKAMQSEGVYFDNQALDVRCYHPGYTFVEKLQTVSTKFRIQQEKGSFPANFLRHYYDVSQLLQSPVVQAFIGTDKYYERKEERFRKDDNQNITENEAFLISDPDVRALYRNAFDSTRSLYFGDQPDFDGILSGIQSQIDRL